MRLQISSVISFEKMVGRPTALFDSFSPSGFGLAGVLAIEKENL